MPADQQMIAIHADTDVNSRTFGRRLRHTISDRPAASFQLRTPDSSACPFSVALAGGGVANARWKHRIGDHDAHSLFQGKIYFLLEIENLHRVQPG
jgi:hypothetical protein